MLELRIYPSGFRGSAKVATTAPLEAERNRERYFSPSAIIMPDPRPGSTEIAKLWFAYSSGAPETKTFEFNEKVIKCALALFGTPYLYEWIVDQRKSPDWDEWHERWIDETLRFVCESRPRELSVYNWTALLNSNGQSAQWKEGDSHTVRKTFLEYAAPLSQITTIEEFVLAWLKQRGGFEDLTESLYILFGPRI